eukprot:38862-Prymnesium_polylepis.1
MLFSNVSSQRQRSGAADCPLPKGEMLFSTVRVNVHTRSGALGVRFVTSPAYVLNTYSTYSKRPPKG